MESLAALMLEAERLAKETSLLPEARRRLSRTERIWRYRSYQGGECASMIDWKQTARGDKILVREPEPITTDPLLIWSPLSWKKPEDKNRAALLLMALTHMLAKGERAVGWLCANPQKSRNPSLALKAACEALLSLNGENEPPSLPALHAATIIIAGDLANAPPLWTERLKTLAAQGNRGLFLNLSETQAAPLDAFAHHAGWPIIKARQEERPEAALLFLFEEALKASI